MTNEIKRINGALKSTIDAHGEISKKNVTSAAKRIAGVLKDELIGNFFHSLDEHWKIKWQGRVLSSPQPGWYYVQLFEWTMGEPNVRKLIHFDWMETWLFYETEDQMKFSYTHGVARAGGLYRDK